MRETVKVSSTKPAKRIIWKVTICRVGTGCQIVGYDAILKHCWRKLVHNDLNKPYITGISAGNGERFGPDLTAAFDKLFSEAKARIWRMPSVAFACQQETIEGIQTSVTIQRFDDAGGDNE